MDVGSRVQNALSLKVVSRSCTGQVEQRPKKSQATFVLRAHLHIYQAAVLFSASLRPRDKQRLLCMRNELNLLRDQNAK
jgi:hypothetical protein